MSNVLTKEKEVETKFNAEILEEKIRKTIRTCCCFLEKLPTHFREFEVKWGNLGMKQAWEGIENKKQLIEEIDMTIDKLIILKRRILFDKDF